MIALTFSRIIAYGEKWQKWCNKNANTKLKNVIPERHRNKILIQQLMHGDYEVSAVLIQEIKRLNLSTPRRWQYD